MDLLAVQGTLKSLFQHYGSILQCSAFFMVQLSHLYMTTGKTIALTMLPSLKKDFFTGVIKLRILRWADYPGLSGWDLHAVMSVLIRARERGI